MRSLDVVRDYFNREADRFDAIYEDRKPLTHRIVDRAFRGVVLERFRLICNLVPTVGDWTVLDVGCGSGRYALALARAGARRVFGVDFSPTMIELARREAQRSGLASVCEFRTGGFLDVDIAEQFDAVIATGYFDYLEQPAPHLRKMLEHCRGRTYFSIPKRWEFRVPVRKLRFALERGYVRFYSRAELTALLREAGIPSARASIIDLGRDWIVVVRKAGADV